MLILRIASEIAVLVLALLAVGFAAAAEIALTMLNRGRLQEALAEGSRRATTVQILLAAPDRFLSCLLLVRTAGVVAAAGAAIMLTRRIYPTATGLLLTLVVLVVLVLVIRIVFKAVVMRSPDAWAFGLAGPVHGLSSLFSPLVAMMLLMGDKVRGKSADEVGEESIFLTENGLRFLIHVGEEEGAIEEEEKEMIASIVEFGDTLVREVMVPRIDVVSLPVDTPVQGALDVIIREGYSRIPVYEDTVDNIVGILYAKDLLGCFRDADQEPLIRDRLRDTYFVPDLMKVDDLLRELQRRRVHIAIVVDEYGGTAGLVTIEDLLEEIVGEIQDEYDTEEPFAEMVAEGEYLFHARINLDDVSDLLGVDLPDAGGNTLGGFIFSQLGRVPVVGDEIVSNDVIMTVQAVDGRRVTRVRAQRSSSAAETLSGSDQEEAGATSRLLSLLTL